MSAPLFRMLVLFNGVLLALVLLLWVLGAAGWSPPAPVAPAIPETIYTPRPVFEAGQDNAMLERPLFWASRRPVAPDAPPPVMVKDGFAEDAQLIGMAGTGENLVALIRTEGTVVRLMRGEKLGSWRLDALDAEGVVFLGGKGDVRRLRMEHAPQDKGATAPSAPPAPRQPAPERKAQPNNMPPPAPPGGLVIQSAN